MSSNDGNITSKVLMRLLQLLVRYVKILRIIRAGYQIEIFHDNLAGIQ